MVLGEERHRGAEHEAFRHRGRGGEEDERVVELLVLVADVAVPVLGEREMRVLTDEERVEAFRLGEPRDLDRLQGVLGRREQDSELGHRRPRSWWFAGQGRYAKVASGGTGAAFVRWAATRHSAVVADPRLEAAAMLDSAPQVDEYALQDEASAAWTAAQPMLGIGRALTVQQELACALRILAKAGWQENVSGHITWAQAGTDNLWCNPWGIWWEETKASDIVLVSPDGEVIDGKWGATGAVFIHTELHRARPDATVVVHGHPYYVTLLASLGVTPPFIHQNSCIFDGDLAFVDEYDGFVSNADAGVLPRRAGGERDRGAAREPWWPRHRSHHR